jgi:2-phosphosulfolactate phosphatase
MAKEKSPVNTVEVCLSPKLFSGIQTRGRFIVIVADILRATTSICTALENGAVSILPVATLREARAWKDKGFPVASEHNGMTSRFADFGNSPFDFTPDRVKGRKLVYRTTNGTRALRLASKKGLLVIGSFLNLDALAGWLTGQGLPVVILCSGWKNSFCLEDTLFAGALSSKLLRAGKFRADGDAAFAAMDLYNRAKNDIAGYIRKASHARRLQRLGMGDDIPFCFRTGIISGIPVFDGTVIVLDKASGRRRT